MHDKEVLSENQRGTELENLEKKKKLLLKLKFWQLKSQCTFPMAGSNRKGRSYAQLLLLEKYHQM
jgi:hypothetical protein